MPLLASLVSHCLCEKDRGTLKKKNKKQENATHLEVKQVLNMSGLMATNVFFPASG